MTVMISITAKPVCLHNYGDIPPEFLARHPGALDKRTVHEQARDAEAGGGPTWEGVFGYPYPGPPGEGAAA